MGMGKAFRIILLFVAALTVNAQAPMRWEWSKGDTWRESAVLAVSAVDWGQTLDIQKRCGYFIGPSPNASWGDPTPWIWKADYHEMNPLLGRNPSRGQINRYFAASMLLHIAAARALPRGWRDGFQYLSIGWELAVVDHNARVGFKVAF